MKLQLIVTMFAVTWVLSSAHGADPETGKRLALHQCAACHIVASGQRREVAQAPPFETIARKYGANAEMLLAAIRGPHPKMNFVPTRRETDDIAAYISTLGK